jgi:hypothetical protein
MALTLVPQVGQNLGNTQAPILANFTFINNNFDVDHVVFNSGADSGKHKKITFPVLYSTVGTMPAFGANERRFICSYNRTTTGGVNEIFVFKNPSFGGGLGSQRFSITENRGNKAGEVAKVMVLLLLQTYERIQLVILCYQMVHFCNGVLLILLLVPLADHLIGQYHLLDMFLMFS